MRRLGFSTGVALLLVGTLARAQDPGIQTPPQDSYGAQPPPDSSQSEPPSEFGQALAPYGQWIYTAQYGWVWQPGTAAAGADFQPYASDGTWVYSDDGWAFDSPLPFAWACFHYGRWYWAANAGWRWVPGSVWAPAWVAWRFGGGYTGWAPLGPPGYRFAIGASGYYPGWTFVHAQELSEPNVWAHRLPPAQVTNVVRLTQPVRVFSAGNRWNRGPARESVERAGAHVVVRSDIRARTSIAAHPSSRARPSQPTMGRPAPQHTEPRGLHDSGEHHAR